VELAKELCKENGWLKNKRRRTADIEKLAKAMNVTTHTVYTYLKYF
jgi:predicted transcriptional regulator YheO